MQPVDSSGGPDDLRSRMMRSAELKVLKVTRTQARDRVTECRQGMRPNMHSLLGLSPKFSPCRLRW